MSYQPTRPTTSRARSSRQSAFALQHGMRSVVALLLIVVVAVGCFAQVW